MTEREPEPSRQLPPSRPPSPLPSRPTQPSRPLEPSRQRAGLRKDEPLECFFFQWTTIELHRGAGSSKPES
jgi:hypothetical protein